VNLGPARQAGLASVVSLATFPPLIYLSGKEQDSTSALQVSARIAD